MGSSFSWRGAGGAFATAASWTDTTQAGLTGTLAPGSADSVDFGAATMQGSTITGGGGVSALSVEAAVTFDGAFSAGSIANTGQLTVAGGSLSTSASLTDNGAIALAGAGWINGAGSLLVGDTGRGSLAVAGAGIVTDASAVLGHAAGSVGSATVAGAGAVWWNAGALFVGDAGGGTLLVQGGATVSGQTVYAGYAAGSTGTITVTGTGSLLYVPQSMIVGDAGGATMTISAGAHAWVGTAASVGALAHGGTGRVTVTGGGAVWSVGQALAVGVAGSGAVSIAAGGTVYAQTLLLASAPGGTGSVLVSGAGALLQTWQSAYVGQAGSATLSVQNGAKLAVGTSIDIGMASTGTGTLSIGAAGTSVNAYATLLVGDAGHGTLNLAWGGQADAASLVVANLAGSTGAVTVDGTGSTIATTTAFFGGSWTASGGSARVIIRNGGRIAATGEAVAWGTAGITLANGTLDAATLVLDGAVGGYGSLAALGPSAGYQVQNAGTITASGGTLGVAGGITGTGTLAVGAGGTLQLLGSVAQTQTVAFLGGTGPETLALGTPAQMQATITGFGGTAQIELLGVTASALQFSGGVLTAIGAGGPDNTLRAVASLRLAGTYTASSFALSSDGKGDTILTAAGGGGTTPAVPPAPENSDYLRTHRFFAASSPWNTPVAAGATTSAIAGIAGYTAGLTSWTPGGGNVAIYYAHDTDPLVAVLYNPGTWNEVAGGAWSRWGNSASVEQQILASSSATNPVPGNPYSTQVNGRTWNSAISGLPAHYAAWQQSLGQVLYMHVPVGARPPSSSDGQTVIIQQDGTAIEMYSAIALSSGQWVSPMFSATDALGGTGTGADNGRTASMVENYAGVLRDTDIAAGSIDHALALAVPASMLTQALAGPALAFDSNSADYSGSLPMGAHLGLAAGLNLASLGLTTSIGQEIAAAAQTYGMYIVDRGGAGISIVTQDNPSSAALKSWSQAAQTDLNTILHHESLLST